MLEPSASRAVWLQNFLAHRGQEPHLCECSVNFWYCASWLWFQTLLEPRVGEELCWCFDEAYARSLYRIFGRSQSLVQAGKSSGSPNSCSWSWLSKMWLIQALARSFGLIPYLCSKRSVHFSEYPFSLIYDSFSHYPFFLISQNENVDLRVMTWFCKSPHKYQ